MQRFARIVLALAALVFLALGLCFWFAPEDAARVFAITAEGPAGLVNLRADLGGLFGGLGILCATGAWTRRRAILLAGASVIGAIALGRVIGWIAVGAVPGIGEIALELTVLVALASLARASHAPSDATHRGARVALVGFGLLLGAGVATLHVPSVQMAVFEAAARELSGKTDESLFADDALRVAIAGSSAPLPSADRAKACVVVFAAGKYWVVDCGPESTENLVLWGIPLSRIGGVLLTHFHSDHIGDLGELQLQTWAGGRPAPLVVYGGPGVAGVVDGFNAAYRLDQGYRTEHHGESVMPSSTWGMRAITVELDGEPSPRLDRTRLVLDEGGLRITAIEVDHAPIAPAYAFRFDYKGRSVVVTGDWKLHPPMARAAADADLLVSEAISRSLTRSLEHAAHDAGRGRTEAIMHDVQDYHVSPEEAAGIANEARVRHLAFYHLLPAPDGWLMRQLFARGVNAVRDGDWSIADDGSLYTLPFDSDEVRVGHVDD